MRLELCVSGITCKGIGYICVRPFLFAGNRNVRKGALGGVFQLVHVSSI